MYGRRSVEHDLPVYEVLGAKKKSAKQEVTTSLANAKDISMDAH